MCGRVIQSSGPLRLAIVEGLNVSDSRMGNVPPRYNAAPSQELLVIRQNHKTGERSLDLIKWGLIPYWCKDPRGGRKPINAKAESVCAAPHVQRARPVSWLRPKPELSCPSGVVRITQKPEWALKSLIGLCTVSELVFSLCVSLALRCLSCFVSASGLRSAFRFWGSY